MYHLNYLSQFYELKKLNVSIYLFNFTFDRYTI